jgi:histidine triad (HIT) family protein
MNHAPAGYRCPMCALVAGEPSRLRLTDDIVRRNDRALAFVAPQWWPRNEGHVLVIPTAHYENLYELPAADGHAVHDLVRDVAVAIRHTYGCDGTSTRQHNEPAGNQHVWHLHVHVFPRYTGDDLYATPAPSTYVPPEARHPYATRLRTYFASDAQNVS